MNSIDPRLVKTMLQLQLMPAVDLMSNRGSRLSSVDQAGGELFNSLLQQVLAGADSAQNGLYGASIDVNNGATWPVAFVNAGEAAQAQRSGQQLDPCGLRAQRVAHHPTHRVRDLRVAVRCRLHPPGPQPKKR